RRRLLRGELRLTGAPAADQAAGARVFLGLAVALARACVVARATASAIGRCLVCAVAAAGHVTAGDVDRHVGVDGVLVGFGLRLRFLQCRRLLRGQLRLTVAPAANLAAGARVFLGLGVGVVGAGVVASGGACVMRAGV